MYLFCVRKLNMTKFEYLWVSVHIYFAYYLCTLMVEEQKNKRGERERERIIKFIYYGILL